MENVGVALADQHFSSMVVVNVVNIFEEQSLRVRGFLLYVICLFPFYSEFNIRLEWIRYIMKRLGFLRKSQQIPNIPTDFLYIPFPL